MTQKFWSARSFRNTCVILLSSVLLLGASLSSSHSAQASEETPQTSTQDLASLMGWNKKSLRTEKRIGVYAALLSEPAPSIWSVNIGWNLADFLQLNAGYGQFSYYAMQVHSGHIGAKVMVPGWNLSPYIGTNVGTLGSNSSFVIGGQTVAPSAFPWIVTAKIGVEWFSSTGFMAGVAYGIALSGPFAGNGTPGLYAGLFF